MIGCRQIQRMLISSCSRMLNPLLHVAEGDHHLLGLHLWVEAIPDGCQVRKARVGSGESERNPRVRTVPEPELARLSAVGTGEVPRDGRVAEGDREAVLLRVLAGEVMGEDMLREARTEARDERSRAGHMEPALNEGWLALSVLVTRGVVAGTRYSYNLPETGACRWGVKGF